MLRTGNFNSKQHQNNGYHAVRQSKWVLKQSLQKIQYFLHFVILCSRCQHPSTCQGADSLCHGYLPLLPRNWNRLADICDEAQGMTGRISVCHSPSWNSSHSIFWQYLPYPRLLLYSLSFLSLQGHSEHNTNKEDKAKPGLYQAYALFITIVSEEQVSQSMEGNTKKHYHNEEKSKHSFKFHLSFILCL